MSTLSHSAPVESLLWQLRTPEVAGHVLELPETEWRFHPTRRWRFDLAWPDIQLAIEVDGAVWTGGRHTRGAGVESDCEKQSTAVSMGWRVMRLTPRMITDGRALTLVIAALQHHQEEHHG